MPGIPRYFSDHERDELERNPEFNRRGSKCPVCLGDGHYLLDGQRFECPDDDYGHPMLRLAKLYWLSWIPLQYQYLDWSEYPHAEAKEEIDMYIENFRRIRLTGMGFTIYGKGLGVGKTWAATHILRELVKQGHTGHFVQFLSTAGYYKLEDQAERQFFTKRVLESEVLVLDEVKPALSSAQRDFLEEKLEEIVRTRTNANFPTIVTSNLTDREFEKEYPRVYSLLAAKNAPVELKGADARRGDEIWQRVAGLAMKGESRPIT